MANYICMKRLYFSFLLIFFPVAQLTYAASVSIDEKKWLVTIYDFVYDFDCSSWSDSVSVCYPSEYTTAEWTDWRKIAYPGSYTANWTTAQWTDWRKIAYPGSYTANWTTAEWTDWRKIAYPNNWTQEEWQMWMRITGNKVELIFREAQYLPLFDIYRKIFSTDDELADFIIYTFLNYSYENNVHISITPNQNSTINYWVNTNNSDELDNLIDNITNNTCWINSEKNSTGLCVCKTGYTWTYPNDQTNYDCKLISTNNAIGTNSNPNSSGEATPIIAANMLWIFWYINLRDTEEEYELKSKILRQEIIGIAIKLKWIILPEDYVCNNKFKDVTRFKPNNWVCRVAETAAESGIISNENILFNPEINVSLTEALAMILNSLDKPYQWYKNSNDLFHPSTVDWQKSVLSYAQHNWIIDSTFVNPNLSVNRWDVFLMITKALGW